MNPEIIDLDIDDVKEGLASGQITLVDVREPQEYAGGHIPGSVSHPLSTFDPEELRRLAGRIVFSCASGIRSIRAIEFAQAAGLALNEHYRGGFKEWAAMGEPVE